MKILQISDIHWTKRKRWNEDFKGMKATFLKDMEQYREANGCIDYVFICGDIAFKGLEEEYSSAKKYVDEICEKIGCSEKDVYVVPGNHDLNRKAKGAPVREIIDAALAFGLKNNSFLDDVIMKPGDLRMAVFEAFRDYHQFARESFCDEKAMGKCLNGDTLTEITDDDDLFYETRLGKKVGDVYVRLRGVNTALNCDANDWNEENKDGHKQILPRRAYVMGVANKQEIRILMGHHPLAFLTNKEEIEDYINKNYHIQLFGHVHSQQVEGDNFVRLQSGAFDPPKDNKTPTKYRPVYNIIEITQKDQKHVAVKCGAQIWDTNQFVEYKEGSFKKVLTIEREKNKWINEPMEEQELDIRGIKFKFMKLDDRTIYFDRIEGLVFNPDPKRTEYDLCLDFLAEVERQGKMKELNKLIEG